MREGDDIGPGATLKRLMNHDNWLSIKEALSIAGMPMRYCKLTRAQWDKLWPYEKRVQ